MKAVKRIKKDDIVKIISGKHKGETGKVVKVLVAKKAVLIEGLNQATRHIKPSQINPRGGKKDIHVPVSLHKVALVIDEKSAKTSRVGFVKTVDGDTKRVAKQDNNKEIK